MTDLAFTTSKFESPIVQVRPAFSEPMFFLCAKDSRYQEPVELKSLDPEQEIYVDWSYEFVHWHSQLFHGRQSKLALSLMNQLQFFLQKEDHWAFVPASVAVGLLADGGIRKLSASFPLPPRVINYLCLEKAMESRRVRRFLECLRQVLLEMEQVEFEIFIS